MRENITHGIHPTSPALLLHECFTHYEELQRCTRWWNRRHYAERMHAYNRTLQRFHEALSHCTGNGTGHAGNNVPPQSNSTFQRVHS